MVDKFLKYIKKEAYLLPVIICLFFVPLFFNPFFINSFTQGKELFFKTVVVASLTGISIFWLLKGTFRMKRLFSSPVFLFLGFGALIMAVSSILSPTPLIPLYGAYSRGFGLLTQAFLFAFIVYCAWILSENEIPKLLKYVFWSAVVVACYGIVQKTGIDPLFSYYNKDIFVGRIFSFLGNPGYLGQFMLLNVIIGTYLVFQTNRTRMKIWYGVGTVLIFAALWFSQTRTSLVALAICTVLAVVRYRKAISGFLKELKPGRKLLGLLGILVVLFCVVLLTKDRFSMDDEALRSLNSRFEIWKGAISLIEKRPWLGYGQDTFAVYSPEIITKQFLTLEEDLNLAIDRIHNELLETVFSYGIFAGIGYLLFFGFLMWKFFTRKNEPVALLALIVIANMLQNQFSFSDITISVLIAFCLGGLIADEIRRVKAVQVHPGQPVKYLGMAFIIIVSLFALTETVYKPFMSQLAYAESHNNYNKSYDRAVTEHKKAIAYAPEYSELWYELMFIDPSSMPRALENIERIEGKSGNLLAWEGNYYAEKDPQKASEYYMEALKKNPYYPNWIRSLADMLYKNGDREDALMLYKAYLEAVPDFWKWKDTLDQHTQKERTSYRIFFKNSPDFWVTVERVKLLEGMLQGKN